MMKKKFKLILMILFVAFLTSCDKADNPYHEDYPAELWTPSELKLKIINSGVELSWSQNDESFDGYILERNIENEEWERVNSSLIDSYALSFTDSIYLPLKSIQYRIIALANMNRSNYAYSSEQTFPIREPLNCSESLGQMTDERDGNIYNTIELLNGQIWMTENLAWLPQVSPPSEGEYSNPYYYVQGFHGNNIEDAVRTSEYQQYGALYNWEAAQNACPTGWRLPNMQDWNELAEFVSYENGGYEKVGHHWIDLGAHLKTTSGWKENGNGTNDFCFSALPAGDRQPDGSFHRFEYFGSWWFVNEYSETEAWYIDLHFHDDHFYFHFGNKEAARGIRCIKE